MTNLVECWCPFTSFYKNLNLPWQSVGVSERGVLPGLSGCFAGPSGPLVSLLVFVYMKKYIIKNMLFLSVK